MLQKLGQRIKNQKGLTLIELLAVIVILGIIAAIAIPSIGNIIQKSKVDSVKSDAVQILEGAKTYIASNGANDDGSDETLDQTKLASYVESTKIPTFTVTVKQAAGNKLTYTIKTAALTVGKQTIEFKDAEIKDINAKTSTLVEIK